MFKQLVLCSLLSPCLFGATSGISSTALYQKLGFEKLAGKIQHGKNYSNTIADTEIKYEMVAIAGGKYTLGSIRDLAVQS